MGRLKDRFRRLKKKVGLEAASSTKPSSSASHTVATTTEPPTELGSSSLQAVTQADIPSTELEAVGDQSLWDKAYNVLYDQENGPVVEYEILLSRVLIRDRDEQLSTPDEAEDTDQTASEFSRRDPISRREKLRKIIELGLKHAEDKKISTTLLGHKLVLQDAVAKTAGIVSWVEGRVKDAVADLPYASLVMAGISLVLPVLTNPPEADAAQQDGLTYVTSQMKYYSAMESMLLPEEMDSELKKDLTDRVLQLYQLIINFQLQSILKFYRSRTRNYLRGVIVYDDWKEQVNKIKEADKDFVSKVETAVSTDSLQHLKRLSQEAESSRKALGDLLKKAQELVDINQDQLSALQTIERKLDDPKTRECLQALRVTNPEHDKIRIEATKGGLLADAWRWVLECEDFKTWRNSNEGQLLWIKGDPGKGKTMMLCGIIDELSSQTRLKGKRKQTSMAYFFLQATDSRINNAPAVLRGLISMLVEQQEALIRHVQEQYDKDGKSVFEGVNAWTALKTIFTGIMADPELQDTYIIVDALDECIGHQRTQDESVTDLIELLQFIQSVKTRPGIKWLVSSRNWPAIENELAEVQKTPLCLELKEESVSAAVATYITFKVNGLAKKNRYTDDVRIKVVEYLSEKAEGTFLWVALVCQKIAMTPGWKILDLLNTYPPTLSALYRRMISQIDEYDGSDQCKEILAVLSAVFRPITLHELTSLAKLPGQITANHEALTELIGYCGSFLTLREDRIFFVHQSAKDFLLKETYASVIKDVHRSVCWRSLQAMSATLKRDIYDLRQPGISMEEVQKPDSDPLAAVTYSCVYWVDHLHMFLDGNNDGEILKDEGVVEVFLRLKYIYWLEALTLLGSLSNGMLLMRKLDSLLQGNDSQLAKIAQDGLRFIQYFKSTVENYPLQIYASALIFSPSSSLTRLYFENDMPTWITTKPTVDADWDARLQVLEGHTKYVFSVSWSPDGTKIATGSWDKTVKIWDPSSGRCVDTFETGRHVKSMDWSSDNKRLAVLLGNGIQIWNSSTKYCLWSYEHGYDDSSEATPRSPQTAWSPDDTQLLSIIKGAVQILDVDMGKFTTLNCDSSAVCAAWMPGSKKVAVAYEDETVVFHELGVGQISKLQLSETAYNISFNNQKKIALVFATAVEVRETTAGECTSRREMQGSISIAWEPSGKQLAIAVGNNVQVWDPVTDECTATLKGHAKYVLSVAWSPDGKYVVSASQDHKAIIWDPSISQSSHTGHTAAVLALSWSPDRRQIASASVDRTVRIWSLKTGKCTATFEGHRDWVRTVAWSPDGRQIASTSYDGTVRIWSLKTGKCTATFEGHADWIRTVAWSPDGRQIASTSYDDTVRIWSLKTGKCTATFEGHADWIRTVAWSPDGRQIASTSYDDTVRIWSLETGECTATFEGHADWIRTVAWSPDGRQIASASNDNTVRIWNLESSQGLAITDNLQTTSLHFVAPDLLQTDFGMLSLRSAVASTACTDLVPQATGYVGGDGDWITYGGKRRIRLPPTYSSPLCATGGNKIALFSRTGQEIFLQLSDV